MATSQNGWPVATADQQDRSPVHGVTMPNGVRRGDVATVLHHLMDRFHREVEELVPGWCWGWHVKVIEGSTSISNHASGTAVDLNAPRHPLGVRNTFTPAQRARIRAILADLDGVVRWGGDYTGRRDDMHFEIVKNAAAVKRVADRIKEDDMPSVDDIVKAVRPLIPTAAQNADAVWGEEVLLPPTAEHPNGKKVTMRVIMQWLDRGTLGTRDVVTEARDRVLADLAALGEQVDALAPAEAPPAS